MKALVDELQAISILEDVPKDQLAWFVSHSERLKIKVGGKLFEAKDPIDRLFIILSGKIEVKIQRGNNYQLINTILGPAISGFLPYSRATSAIASGLVVEEVELFALSKSCCTEMTLNHYELTEVFVHEMTSRTS